MLLPLTIMIILRIQTIILRILRMTTALNQPDQQVVTTQNQQEQPAVTKLVTAPHQPVNQTLVDLLMDHT